MVSIIDKIQQIKKKRTLKKMAALEFEQARGKQHLNLLAGAQQTLMAEVNKLDTRMKSLQQKHRYIEDSTHKDLLKELEHYIVTTRIFEVPGIGKRLGEAIIRHIYKDSINDLRYAWRIQGIGDNKQYEINRWISFYEREMPRLLKKDFPGKKHLLLVAAKKIYVINEEIEKLQERKTTLENKLKLIHPWIEKLGKVSREDFINARFDGHNHHKEIVSFINGIYGEWEPMPEWFKDVLNEANNV